VSDLNRTDWHCSSKHFGLLNTEINRCREKSTYTIGYTNEVKKEEIYRSAPQGLSPRRLAATASPSHFLVLC